jgi:hypothetical protein
MRHQSLHSHSCRVEHGLAIRLFCTGFEHPVQLENQVAWQLERLSKARSTDWHHDCSPIGRTSVEALLQRHSIIALAITLGSILPPSAPARCHGTPTCQPPLAGSTWPRSTLPRSMRAALQCDEESRAPAQAVVPRGSNSTNPRRRYAHCACPRKKNRCEYQHTMSII